MEEANFLTKFASKVTVVHRRDALRASKIMLERARSTENIELKTPFVVEEFLAGDNGALDRARLRNVETGETEELSMDGAFIAIGHEPQSGIVDGIVDTDDDGYVVTEGKSTRTNVPGVFAAGDLVDAIETVSEEELFRWCVDQLPYFALPRYIEFRAELPRSPVGRVLKRELRAEGVTATTWDAEAAGVTYERR